MKLIRTAFLIMLFLAMLPTVSKCGAPTFAAQTTGLGWDPLHTKVFVVGVLKWKSNDLDSFSLHHRRDKGFVRQFVDLGVPRDKIVYLGNEKATLQAIKTGLAKSLQSCQPDDTFIFYYCGHGWLDDDNKHGYFGNYDAGDTNESALAIDDIVTIFKKNFRGSQALFLTDCCRSGALADALQASKCGLKFGALAAATSGEDSTGNWTFTQAVIDCLAGHNYADFNKDGVITFAEMGTYVKDEMKLMEGQVASVISGNGFDSQMKIAKVVFEREVIPERVEVKFDGDWWKAKLLERRGQKGLVQWFEIGWDAPEDDTWVPLQNIRPIRGGTARGAAARVASPDIASKYSVNQKIQVLSDGEYYPAVVRKVDDQRYFIHYDDYDTSSDEWVGVDRIKFKSNKVASSQSGTTSARQVDTPKFSVNQKVRVLSEGEYYPAVVKKIGGNRFLVHYDGYDASDDEWVGVKRIKLKATQK